MESWRLRIYGHYSRSNSDHNLPICEEQIFCTIPKILNGLTFVIGIGDCDYSWKTGDSHIKIGCEACSSVIQNCPSKFVMQQVK